MCPARPRWDLFDRNRAGPVWASTPWVRGFFLFVQKFRDHYNFLLLVSYGSFNLSPFVSEMHQDGVYEGRSGNIWTFSLSLKPLNIFRNVFLFFLNGFPTYVCLYTLLIFLGALVFLLQSRRLTYYWGTDLQLQSKPPFSHICFHWAFFSSGNKIKVAKEGEGAKVLAV